MLNGLKMADDAQTKKFLGALIGTAAGDAVGAGFEGCTGYEPYLIETFIEDRDMLRYTDDTHMMIGLAESLIEKNGFDGEHMAHTFMRNYRSESWRGYGPGPPQLFRLMEEGYSWDTVSEMVYPGGSYGNGSAMRVAPVGVLYGDDPVLTKEIACKTSSITHCHELGKEGAALQALAVAFAVRLPPCKVFSSSDFLSFLERWSDSNIYSEKLNHIKVLLPQSDKEAVIDRLGNSIEAVNSIPAAIYAFLAHPFSYHDAVLYAVSLGGDTDTIGAMTGALSGAYLGIEAIPWQWRMKLENGAYIGELALNLLRMKKGK